MNDKDFLFWLQGVLEVKVKFKGSKELQEILKDVREHNEGSKGAVSGRSELLLAFVEHIKKDNELTETVNANDVEAFIKSQQ